MDMPKARASLDRLMSTTKTVDSVSNIAGLLPENCMSSFFDDEVIVNQSGEPATPNRAIFNGVPETGSMANACTLKENESISCSKGSKSCTVQKLLSSWTL
jgi:hypothetical protein